MEADHQEVTSRRAFVRRGAPARRWVGATGVAVAMALSSSSAVAAPTDDASTSTSEQHDGTVDDGGNLPAATIEALPAEDSLPPAPTPEVPPAPPPGADEAGRRRAQVELRDAEVALRQALRRAAALDKRLTGPARRLAAARAAFAAAAGQDHEAAASLTDARSKMKRVAVAGYVRGGDTQPLDYLLRAADPVDLERRRAIVKTATEARRTAVEQYSSTQRDTSARLEAAVVAVEAAEADVAAGEAERRDAATAVYLLTLAVGEKRQLLDHASAAVTVGGTDIPRLFLDAYRQAAAKLTQRAPHCRVSWTAIAAIGKVESNHGRYRGAQFALNGDVFPRILGISLDGTRSALIRDTDTGLLDEDVEFDRAVGPMQFIPSTWVRINEDGNRDGTRDPNNIYDAALGTAAYLCRAVPSGGLDTEDGLRPAFFSYNRSSAYVELVLEWSRTYAGAAVS